MKHQEFSLFLHVPLPSVPFANGSPGGLSCRRLFFCSLSESAVARSFISLIRQNFMGHLFFPFVSLSVAIILFEGSLTLNFKEIPGLQSVVRNMLSFRSCYYLADHRCRRKFCHWCFLGSWPFFSGHYRRPVRQSSRRFKYREAGDTGSQCSSMGRYRDRSDWGIARCSCL